MNRTITALRKLFLALFQEAKVWDSRHRQGYSKRKERKPTAKAQKAWETLAEHCWPPIKNEELEEWLPISDELQIDFSEKKRVLYMPPLEKNADFVPVLSLKCYLSETKTSIRLRVMMIALGEAEEFHGIGFRMESPESESLKGENPENSNDNDGLHDFYHAQLIQSFGSSRFDQKLLVECPSWLPVTQPSFPLTADCPVTLFFSLLLTLYGKNYCREFFHNHNQLSDLKKQMDKLNGWIKWTN